MSADLEHTEAQLKSHFERLAEAKSTNRQTLFALEHCLDADGVSEMRRQLRASIRKDGMSARFRHCWLVHAAEHGYTFEGHEFWRSFAELTPHWSYSDDRDKLRGWFFDFARRLNGACPKGSWGKHFKFIAWPITHALLPTDLQVQLAHVLYQMRYRIDELIERDDEAAGQLLATYVELPTTRFRHFLGQHEIVGCMVRALLDENPSDQTSIYPPTLQRITDDLNAKSEARAWLHDARRYAHRTYTRLGVANPRFPLVPAMEVPTDDPVLEMDRHGILLRPRLLLQQTGANRWEAQLLVPSFDTLINLKPQFRGHLSRTRYRIPAHGNALFPGISLLSGRPVPRRLNSWPKERTPLLKFVTSDIAFDRIVDAECQLLPAKIWLFQVVDGDIARQVQGQHVRAGLEYVVVARDAGLINSLGDVVALNCSDVTAVHLSISKTVGNELAAVLKRAGIALHSHLFVEPIGLRPRQWTEVGAGEWLSTERPMFALSCELDIAAFQIAVNGNSPFEIPCNEMPTLIALHDLGVGRHRVAIAAMAAQRETMPMSQRCVAKADIEVYVRNPTTWSPRAQLSAAMVVDVVPSVPSLDDLLAQRVQLRAEGDESRTVTCSLVLAGLARGEDRSFKILSQRLPIRHEAWQNRLSEYLGQCDELDLLNVSEAMILVDAEDLGVVRIPLLIEMQPLRWTVARSRSGTELFLVDEGVSDQIKVMFYSFDQPLRSVNVDTQEANRGIDCSLRSGLYLAHAGHITVAIAVSVQERARGLASLGSCASRTELSSEYSPSQLLGKLRIWSDARTSSYSARLKLESVCKKIRDELLRRICGTPWMRAERAIDEDGSDDNWRMLEGAVGHSPSFAIALTRNCRRSLMDASFDLHTCLEGVAIRHGVTSDTAMIELAWQIASKPTGADDSKLAQVALNDECFRTLVRGARLLVLCREQQKRAS